MAKQQAAGLPLVQTHEAAKRISMARRYFSEVVHHLFILIPLVLTFFPFFMTLQISFKSFPQLLYNFWLPGLPLHLENYVWAFNEIYRFMLNSLFVSGMTLTGMLLCSSLAAYAFARIDFVLHDAMYYAVIALLMVPGVLTLIGRYLLIARMGLMDSLWGLILPYISGELALAVFLMNSFFKELPEELFESARMDGATHLRMYWHIALPLSKPIMSVVGLLAFLDTWGDYIWPLLVLRTQSKFTLMLGLATFSGSNQIEYGPLMAGYVLASIPTTIIIILMMRTFSGAALAGAFK